MSKWQPFINAFAMTGALLGAFFAGYHGRAIRTIETQITELQINAQESKASADHEKVRANLCIDQLSKRKGP